MEANFLVGNQPWPAIIVAVHDDRTVNLAICDPHGRWLTAPGEKTPLLQDDDKPPEGGNFCQWMDFQKGQAQKTDTLTPQVLQLDAERQIHEKFIRELFDRVAKLESAHAGKE